MELLSGTTPAPRAPDFRLARVLSQGVAREGSFSALAKAIAESSPPRPKQDQDRDDRKGKKRRKKGKWVVDRRKLKSLVEGRGDVVLSLDQLRALDRYLERYGAGLAYLPLFEKPDLMQTLADSGRVTFLLGSKPERESRSFSHWDVLAMAEIQRAINPSEISVRFDIQDVLLDEDLDKTVTSAANGVWEDLLHDQGPSLVCLGSSRTGPAAEVMLCQMFDCPRFTDPPLAQKQRLPFHFVWDPKLDYIFPSHFHLGSDDISLRDPEAANAIKQRKASAVVTAEEVFVDRVFHDHEGDTYGVCVAQRRKRGQVWLVMAGVTGVATFVAAKLAKSLATSLQEQKSGQDSDVYWAVIRARVVKDPDRPLNSRRAFEEEAIVSGLHVWTPEEE
jgi:hypothetical protein